MSKQKTPVLSSVIPVYERFLYSWEYMAEKNPSLTYFINEGLRWAYKYYEKMLRPTAYIIAMCEFPISETLSLMFPSYQSVYPSIMDQGEMDDIFCK